MSEYLSNYICVHVLFDWDAPNAYVAMITLLRILNSSGFRGERASPHVLKRYVRA